MLEDRKKPFWKFAEYALYAFFFLFPLTSYQGFLYGGTSIRAISLMFLVCILLIAFGIRSFRSGNSVVLFKSPIFIALATYLAVVFISALSGLSFETSFWSSATRTTGIIYFIILGFFIYFLTNILSNRERQSNLILTIIISTGIYAFLALLGPEGLGLIFKGYKADGFTIGNSTFAAMYIFGAFLLSIYYIAQAEVRKKWMYVFPIILVVNPYILNSRVWFGDFSKGLIGEAQATSYVMVLSVIALGAIWLVSKIKDFNLKKKVVYSLFAASILVMVFSVFSLLSEGGILRNFYLSQSSGIRPITWDLSAEVISERPYFGWGTDNFERVFENNYDNRVLQSKYGGEAWLDRAHNVFVDQSVENGIIGLIAYLAIYLTIILCLIYSSLNSKDKIDRVFSSILIVYFTLHLLELQTAFDTTVSYPIIAFMVASAIILFSRARKDAGGKDEILVINNNLSRYIIGSMTVVVGLWLVIYALYPFYSVQRANVYIREVGSAEKRIDIYPQLFSSPIDGHAFLWRIAVDFQKGVAENPRILNDPNQVSYLKQELQIIEDEYKKYINKNPYHFRAYLNLADVLIYQRLFDVDKLEEAQLVLDKAIEIVPQSPQSYWMKAVAYVYMGKFESAREYANKGVELNPDIKLSHSIVEYVEKSIKNFPDLDLYFFQQI